jgi:hypothetical protein
MKSHLRVAFLMASLELWPRWLVLRAKQPQKSPNESGFLSACGGVAGLFVHLAEEAGFEPAVGLTPRTLSRRMT